MQSMMNWIAGSNLLEKRKKADTFIIVEIKKYVWSSNPIFYKYFP